MRVKDIPLQYASLSDAEIAENMFPAVTPLAPPATEWVEDDDADFAFLDGCYHSRICYMETLTNEQSRLTSN